MLYVSYILGPFYAAANHVTCVQVLTLLHAHIGAIAERYKLPPAAWRSALTLLEEEMVEVGLRLEDEIAGGAFETMPPSVWDGTLGVYRRQLAVSWLAGVKLLQRIRGDKDWKKLTAEEFVKANREANIYWGDGSSAGCLVRFWLFQELLPAESPALAEAFLLDPLNDIVAGNGGNSDLEMVSPYYTLANILPFVLGIATMPILEDFAGRTYTGEAFVEMLARYGHRKLLAPLWRKLTHLSYVEYQAKEPWQLLRWRNREGHE